MRTTVFAYDDIDRLIEKGEMNQLIQKLESCIKAGNPRRLDKWFVENQIRKHINILKKQNSIPHKLLQELQDLETLLMSIKESYKTYYYEDALNIIKEASLYSKCNTNRLNYPR